MKIEPNADMRQMALFSFELYTAYLDAGFAETQALQMVAIITTQHMNGGTE